VDDVLATVRYAKAHGKRIGIKSGGHSWAANHLRDGAVLLDMSRVDHTDVDAENGVAVVGPGKGGSELIADLDRLGLFFPAGHCKGVRIGGYLLQGGYGWNSRVYGPACESVIGLDVVTADGEQIHINAENHPDLYWAARGSGPGFFAIVTAFHLKLYPKPAVLGSSFYAYSTDYADEIYSWAREISGDVDRRVEVQIVMSSSVPNAGIDRPAIVLASPVFADTEDEARQAFGILDRCPIVDKALVAVPYAPVEMPAWYEAVMSNYLADHRYTADNMWTSASAAELLPGIHRIIETMPPHPAHFLWLNWGPSPQRQDMAYSLEDEIYLALYSGWMDPADDEKYADWPRSNMAAMAHLASGIQLADENLGERPARFATDENMAKLDRVRAEYDPDSRFYPWMGRA
jgi:FAD/FMN-containing dehydrogenase